jgi:replicative DNA helicase
MSLETDFGIALPPHSIDAEQALLGAILINNRAHSRVADFLKPEHFYEPAHGRIYASMDRLIQNGRVADMITMGVEFDQDTALRELDGRQYLERLARAAETVMNAEDYGRHIHDLATRRGIINVCRDGSNRAHDSGDTTPGIAQLQDMQTQLDLIALDQPAESWLPVSAVLARMADRLADPSEVFSTGLSRLDGELSGGIRPGLVYGIEARMKQGKTLLAGTIALSLMRQDCPMLFLALEMGSDRILERMVASETKCNAMRFAKREDPANLIRKIHAFGDRYNSRRAYFADEPGLTFDRMRRLVDSAVAKLGIKVLFLDYWQLIGGADPRQSSAEHYAATAQWLASFAARTNCAVVLMSQSNRDGMSYGSDGLAKACDWLATLHKTELDVRHVGIQEMLWLDVLYNRDGAGGTIGTDADPAFRIDKIGPIVRDSGDW